MRVAVKTLAIALYGLTLFGGVARADAPPDPVTAEWLIARAVEATGGEANWLAINSMRTTATLQASGSSFRAQMAWVERRPAMVRHEFSMQGLTSVNAYDGSVGWKVEPFGGRRDPDRVSGDEVKSLAQMADIEGPYIHWKDKGHKIEYVGREDVEGTLAYKLKLTRKDGDIDTDYLDPERFLTLRTVNQSFTRGVEQVSQTDFGDYRRVGGVLIPFVMESGGKGQPASSRILLDRVEINVPLADSLFSFPAKGVRVERAILAGAGAREIPGEPAPALSGDVTLDRSIIAGLGARNIGSARMSGRVAALAAFNKEGRTTVYVGAASGGVWKSMDGATTFKPVFDRNPVQSIGAIAIDPSHKETIWVGTGEAWTRNSVSVGDGIYKSTDGGDNWTNMGLKSSERISKIVVNPKNSDVVYACVPGKLWSDSADRGLYKTRDGGKSWSLILKGSNLSTGCSGITLDPRNPEVLLAGLWDFRRKGWTFRSGGEGPDAASGSGLFRSSDGGQTWRPLDARSAAGLPAAPWGRVEVDIAPSNPKVVYAMIESKESGLYRSSDGGLTWEARDRSSSMVWRPFYFGRLIIDPTNPERLFKPDLSLIVSQDGGKSFSYSAGSAHGDWHDVWIDPDNPQHLIGGDDGGLWVSLDGGSRWWRCENLPISQFYHVAIDDKDPYQVYGGLQDNGSWAAVSSYPGGIPNSRWYFLNGGDGFWVIPDPGDPEIVYAESQGGFIDRVDRRTREGRSIQPLARYQEKLRYNWNTPIAVSPTRKDTLYIGAQFLFRSHDRGNNWERISPDLTTNDPDKQKQELSGGVTVDNSSAEMHTTIYSISESPLNSKVIWVGTDDGNLQLTEDSGAHWKNVVGNVTGLPPASWVSWVEASRHKAGTAYAAFDRHTTGDMTPWVYRTEDFGKTWTRIVTPEQGVRGYAHVIKEDAVNPSLLFVGTEMGLWISLDGGHAWMEFKGGEFPSVAVRDLQVHPRTHDLVIATHGRGIWIIDDLTPLRALSSKLLGEAIAALPSRPTEQRLAARGEWTLGDNSYSGSDAREGAAIHYYQRGRSLFGPTRIEILDSTRHVVDTVPATNRRGINRVYWSMERQPPRVPHGVEVAVAGMVGPRMLPGSYTARITSGGKTVEAPLDVRLDRRARFTIADRKAELEALLRVGRLFEAMARDIDRMDLIQGSARERITSLGDKDALTPQLTALDTHVETLRKLIVATKEGGAVTGEERLREHADQLYGMIGSTEAAPSKYQVERIEALEHELADVTASLDQLIKKDVSDLNTALVGKGLVKLPTEPPAPAASGEGGLPPGGHLRMNAFRLGGARPFAPAIETTREDADRD